MVGTSMNGWVFGEVNNFKSGVIMKNITQEQFKSAVHAFLAAQINKKTETYQKQLIKAQENQNYEKVAELQEKIQKEQSKYQIDNWMQKAAEKFTNQLTFGTHISKGIHPDSKGENIIFNTERKLPEGVFGSQNIPSEHLDANGNAAALPLAAFYNWFVDEEEGIKIKDLIKTSHPVIEGAFASEKKDSDDYQQSFENSLNSEIKQSKTHERNKQMLFPLSGNNKYHCIIPLYPSVLTHEFYQTLNNLKYSEENKIARNNRFKKTAEQKPYLSLSNIAVTQLGGTKPQNVSQLMSKQGGRNYLLPSMPPIFKTQRSIRLNQYDESFFNKQLAYHCREPLNALFKLIQTNYNNVNIRDARKTALDSILYKVLTFAVDIQNNETPGWSINYNLNHHEKLWLDPQRADLEDQEPFKQDRTSKNWRNEIAVRFANWLNTQIQKKFKQIKHDFGDVEHIEWRQEMTEMIKESQRLGKEVFA